MVAGRTCWSRLSRQAAKCAGLISDSLLFTSSVFAAEKKIKPKKTPLIKLSKQLKNGELIKIQSFQTAFKAMIAEKCIGKGVHEGGDHGKEFMPEYLKFWKDNLH